MSLAPYFAAGDVELYCGDARELPTQKGVGCLVLDPPWDEPELFAFDRGDAPSLLAFCDGRSAGAVFGILGAPSWLFTWDCLNTWQTGPHRPVQRTKHCLWYGDLASYERDGALWGEAPPPKDHPGTKQAPLAGRRLTDLWRESLRWLHNPAARGSGAQRHQRHGNAAWQYAKPVGWLRCLLANCSTGLVLDPFAGVGTTLVAAKELGRPAVGVELSEELCEIAARRLDQGVLALGVE